MTDITKFRYFERERMPAEETFIFFDTLAVMDESQKLIMETLAEIKAGKRSPSRLDRLRFMKRLQDYLIKNDNCTRDWLYLRMLFSTG